MTYLWKRYLQASLILRVTIALVMGVLVGIVGGIARQSLMAFALGIGGGMGLYNTPTVVESVMSATLPVVASTQEVIGTTVPAISAVLLGT